MTDKQPKGCRLFARQLGLLISPVVLLVCITSGKKQPCDFGLLQGLPEPSEVPTFRVLRGFRRISCLLLPLDSPNIHRRQVSLQSQSKSRGWVLAGPGLSNLDEGSYTFKKEQLHRSVTPIPGTVHRAQTQTQCKYERIGKQTR